MSRAPLGLREDFPPDGTLATVLVEKLAMILWRQRRVTEAESAAINETIWYSAIDTRKAQTAEAWDCSRSGASTGGMLKHADNPQVLRQAIVMLKTVRCGVKECGFQQDPWILTELYGLNYNGSAPFGTLIQIYLNMAKQAAECASGNAGSESVDDLKNTMLGFLDKEIERIGDLVEDSLLLMIKRNQYWRAADVVPPPAVSERLMRYEAHLSREFDRTLAQLERLQRLRQGQPVAPRIDVSISR